MLEHRVASTCSHKRSIRIRDLVARTYSYTTRSSNDDHFCVCLKLRKKQLLRSRVSPSCDRLGLLNVLALSHTAVPKASVGTRYV